MTRINLIAFRQQAASLGVAALVSVGLLGSMTGLAHGYDVQAQALEASAQVAVQTVVVVGKRPA